MHRQRLIALGGIGEKSREHVVGRVGATLFEELGQVVLCLCLDL